MPCSTPRMFFRHPYSSAPLTHGLVRALRAKGLRLVVSLKTKVAPWPAKSPVKPIYLRLVTCIWTAVFLSQHDSVSIYGESESLQWRSDVLVPDFLPHE